MLLLQMRILRAEAERWEDHPPTENVSESQISPYLQLTTQLSTLQCLMCKQIMWSWCGQLRWCHPLINWSEHDTHSHWLYNNLMIVIFSGWYLQSSHILMTGPGPPSPVFPHSCLLLPLSPHSTHRLLPSQPKLAGDRSVVRFVCH